MGLLSAGEVDVWTGGEGGGLWAEKGREESSGVVSLKLLAMAAPHWAPARCIVGSSGVVDGKARSGGKS